MNYFFVNMFFLGFRQANNKNVLYKINQTPKTNVQSSNGTYLFLHKMVFSSNTFTYARTIYIYDKFKKIYNESGNIYTV